MRNVMEPVFRTAPRRDVEPRSGHFRLYFTGFCAKPAGGPAAPDGPSAWNAPGGEDERAYFQADISWINLAENDSPHTSMQTAMITGDVRGLRKRTPGDADNPAPSGEREWQPLSLGTYALVSGGDAISIANFGILPAAFGRISNEVIFLTYQYANALSGQDQGFGRGVFPIKCSGWDGMPEYTLYFRIERLSPPLPRPRSCGSGPQARPTIRKS